LIVIQKVRENAIVDAHDYQIPVTQLGDYQIPVTQQRLSDTRYLAKGSAKLHTLQKRHLAFILIGCLRDSVYKNESGRFSVIS